MKINPGQFTLSKWKQRRFDYLRAKGHVFAYLRNRYYWHNLPKKRKVLSFPDHVDIEISSACNLRCPMCYTITDEFKEHVSRQFMDLELFKRLVDECGREGVYSIRISLRGEAFLHKDVVEMIRYAKEAGIKEVASLTNLYTLTPGMFEEALKAGLDWLTISFDGLEDSYEKIRAPAKYEEMYNRVKKFKAIKDRYRSKKPLLKVQTIWPAIEDDPESFYKAFDPYVDHIAANTLVDFSLRKEGRHYRYRENFTCPVLYQRLAVGSDGNVLLCSNEMRGTFVGDANINSLKEIWHGPAMTKNRKLHEAHKGHIEIKSCSLCPEAWDTEIEMMEHGKRKIQIQKYSEKASCEKG